MPDQEGAPAPVEQVLTFLRSGQRSLYDAVQAYERTLSPEEHWWLGVCLAATVLADLSQVPHVAMQVELLVDRIGARGINPATVEELVNELAKIDSLGLLWPVYERDQGQWRRSQVEVAPGFGPEEAYWVAVAHLGVALMVREGRQEEVAAVAQAIGEMVTSGLHPDHAEAVLAAFRGSTGQAAES